MDKDIIEIYKELKKLKFDEEDENLFIIYINDEYEIVKKSFLNFKSINSLKLFFIKTLDDAKTKEQKKIYESNLHKVSYIIKKSDLSNSEKTILTNYLIESKMHIPYIVEAHNNPPNEFNSTSFLLSILPSQNILIDDIGFSTNGCIRVEDRMKKYYWIQRENKLLFDKIIKGTYCLVYGTRSSGKTTTVVDTSEQLFRKGFLPLHISFGSSVSFSSEENFWDTFTSVIIHAGYPLVIRTGCGLFSAPNKKIFGDKKVVLFIDEFDMIFKAKDDVKESIMNQIREWSQGDKSIIHCCIGVGPYSITNISKRNSFSPFNVSDALETNNFTLDEVKNLFSYFEKKCGLTIDNDVKEEIHRNSGGHPGLVNLCGRVLDEYKSSGCNKITYDEWIHQYSKILFRKMITYQTTKRLVELIDESTPTAIEIMEENIIMFPKPIDFPYVLDEDRSMLVSHGLLQYCPIKGNLVIPSVFIYNLLMIKFLEINRVIYPSIPIPLMDDSHGDRLVDIPALFSYLLPKFPFGRNMSTKFNRGPGIQNTEVPSENFYHFQFSSHLSCWFPKDLSVSPSVKSSGRKRVDLIIKWKERVHLLEFAAHTTDADIEDHIKRTDEYRKELNADIAWMISVSLLNPDFTIDYEKSIYKYPEVGILDLKHDLHFSTFKLKYHRPQDFSSNNNNNNNKNNNNSNSKFFKELPIVDQTQQSITIKNQQPTTTTKTTTQQ